MQVLEEHDLSCVELLHVKSDGVVLTRQSMSIQNFQLMLVLEFMHMILVDYFITCLFCAGALDENFGRKSHFFEKFIGISYERF